MSEVISSFKSLRVGSQVFALLMSSLCVILHTMWSRKSLQLGVFAILLLNVMDVLFEVLYWIDHVWSSKNVCCACDLGSML